MSVRASSLRQSGKYRFREQAQQVRPHSIKELQQVLDPQSSYPPPFRPMGAGSSSTDCTSSTAGTVVDMTAFTEIINVDAYNDTVTCQAGVRIATLIEELAEHGLELVGSHDLLNRTVGGAVAGGCIGPSIGDDGGFFASQVLSIKLVTPDGKRLEVKNDSQNLLNAFRLSYGMLGIIYQVTMRVRPITPFAATHRRCTVKA
ncbi:MAG: FAD-binding oxidoreductase, partial [Gammaproteobacteria bacterium]|nr:FAD-binding oxidoreductase [Gammaproteobacteria bacterium]